MEMIQTDLQFLDPSSISWESNVCFFLKNGMHLDKTRAETDLHVSEIWNGHYSYFRDVAPDGGKQSNHFTDSQTSKLC